MPTALFRCLLPALAVLLLAGAASAQQAPPAVTPADSAARPPHPAQPLWLLDSRVVLGYSLETLGIQPADIGEIDVIKGPPPARWQAVAGNGLLVLRLKPGTRVPARSLPSLRRQLGVRGPVRYELDGQPLTDETLRVATQAIAGLSVRPPAPGTAASTVVIRLQPYRPQPKSNPPGTIYIRGTDGR